MLLFSLALVVVFAPLWLDPITLSEVTGRTPETAPPSSLGPQTPGPDGSPGQTDPPAADVVLAADTFARTGASGWGAADTGGAWIDDGEGALSVEPGSGMAVAEPGDRGSVGLPSVTALDIDLAVSVALGQLPEDGNAIAYVLLRTQNGAAYRYAIQFEEDGTILAGIESMRNGVARELDDRVVVRPAGQAAATLNVRATATGSDPTTIRLRAWPAGQPEPQAWNASVVDWSGALQGDGAIGLGWALATSADEPITFSFSNLNATTTTGGTE